MDFLLGCNYWASNAGAEMWRNFDKDVIREDLRVLSEHGVAYMRVFPNWRDFQPIMPLYTGSKVGYYCLEGERTAENPYYLDTQAMEHFSEFLDLCDEFGIKLIVGLLTGWMSGRLFIPSALYGKNIITDPLAIYFEQLFIKGFVSRFKSRDTIFAWDLGNECNCMGKVQDKYEAANWTAAISNSIRAEDPTRPVVSGMHGIEVARQKNWQISDQAMFTDILTTHPYPYWCEFTTNDELLSLRTTMHATAQNKYYAECGGKPCMAEEIGSMGPMLASDEAAAKFLRTNFYSLWAIGSLGCMWWCGHEQTLLTTHPYTTNMVERELGMLRLDRSPKPVMLEMKKFSEFLKTANFTLPEAATDAVCLLSDAQRQWGVCFISHVLAQKAGLNFRYAYADDGIPEADTYLLPSIYSITVMHSSKYRELCERVRNGATLYISNKDGVLAEFEALTGVRIADSYESPDRCEITVNGKNISVNTSRTYFIEPTTAEVLLYDKRNNPCLTVNNYGKGKVIYLNMPLEEGLIDGHRTLDGDAHEVYKLLFKDKIEAHPIRIEGKDVLTTYHYGEGKAYAVAVNHSNEDAKIDITARGYKLVKVYHGSENCVGAFDASVLEFVKE